MFFFQKVLIHDVQSLLKKSKRGRPKESVEKLLRERKKATSKKKYKQLGNNAASIKHRRKKSEAISDSLKSALEDITVYQKNMTEHLSLKEEIKKLKKDLESLFN